MLRARLLPERGNSYVCALCRHKLAPAERQLRNRRPLGSATSITSSASSRSSISPLSSIWHARALSTSALRRTPDNKKKPGFPGGFGAGLGGFGGFGAQENGNDKETSKFPGLLPHEIEARQRRGPVANRPASSPSSNPRPKNDNSERKPKGARFGLSQSPQRSNQDSQDTRARKQQRKGPQTQQSPSASNALLAEALRTNRSSSSSRSFNQSDSSSPSQSGFGLGQSGWGAFSDRQVDIKVPSQKHQARSRASPPQNTKPPTTTPGNTSKGSDDVWGQLKRASRTSTDRINKKGKHNSDDFWDALESRVANIPSKKFSAQNPEPIEELVEVFPAKEAEEPQPKRKSRFEVAEEEERSTSSRNKKNKKRQRQSREDEDDWDDASVSRWEAKQQRKAEKEAKQLAAEQEPEPVKIFLPEYISVANLAKALKIQQKPFLGDLEQMGFEDLTGDTIMTGDTAALVAMEYGLDPTVDTGSQRDLRPQPPAEDQSSIPSRPPVVTIMGHVDHGKTTLLDWLRKSSIAAQEHGGITQHIGAFVVQMSSGKQITFLDTPGHAAFLSMRQRGANVTDIVILVVAADDSVMPQTLEALKHARAAKVPIIVAINKIDKEDARVDQVKADLSRHGVEIEDYGGDVQVVCVSGRTGQGMEDLEENIVTLSEILDVRAEPDGMAEGWILESSVKQTGKLATVLVKRGTLRLGDCIVAGKTWARIRGLRNEAGIEVQEAPPGTPVQILGWRELPEAGEQVLQAPDENKAKTAVDYRLEMAEREESSAQLAEQEQRQREKVAAEEAAAAAEADGAEVSAEGKEPGVITQNFVVKADVAGSVEAVCGTIQEIGNNEVQSKILRSSAGLISEYDVDHAQASNSIIVNFNNTILPHIRHRAEEAKVRIIDHSIIYQVVDDVKAALSDLLPASVSHRVLGEADVLQIFSINIKKRVFKNIAGCKIRNGAIKRTSRVKVLRGGKVVFDGKIDTLKHVKKDVMEMGKGSECGIGFEDFEDLQIDDQVQTYEEIREKRHL